MTSSFASQAWAKRHDIVIISQVSESPNAGIWDSYRILIEADGTTLYDNPHDKARFGKLPKDELNKILALFTQGKFKDLREKYVDSHSEEGQAATLVYRSLSQKKSVEVVGQAPPEPFLEIQWALLEAAGYLPLLHAEDAKAFCELEKSAEVVELDGPNSCVTYIRAKAESYSATAEALPVPQGGWNAALVLRSKIQEASRKGLDETTLAESEEWLHRFGEDFILMDLKAQTLLHIGKWDEGAAALKQVAEHFTTPAAGVGLYNAALIRMDHGQLAEAAALFDEFGTRDPQSFLAPIAKARALQCRRPQLTSELVVSSGAAASDLDLIALRDRAREGDSTAEFKLASADYLAGHLHRALFWFRRAARDGNKDAYAMIRTTCQAMGNEGKGFNGLAKIWEKTHHREAFQELFILCNGTSRKRYCEVPDEQLRLWFPLWWPEASDEITVFWSGSAWQKRSTGWQRQRP